MMAKNWARESYVALLVGGAIACWPSSADASILDFGVQGGVLKRTLSDVDYQSSFAWQLHAEMSFLPPILMAGPYITFASSSAEVGNSETPSKIDFRTIGFRVKLKIPITDDFAPFGVVGAGWAHGNFPDQVVTVCNPPLPACIQRSLPNATANFAELMVGGGVMWVFAPPLALSAELNWRPTTGYNNDVYERQIQAKDTSAPDPSRNGVAWAGLLGIEISL